MPVKNKPNKKGIFSLILLLVLSVLVVVLSEPIYRVLSGKVGQTEYTSVQQGYGGEVKVTLAVKDGVIRGLAAEGPSETPGIGQKAIAEFNTSVFSELSGTSVTEASFQELDAVSGATITSGAVSAGYQDVLRQAAGAVNQETDK